MITRRRTKTVSAKKKLSLMDQPKKAPDDIVDLDEQFNNCISLDDKQLNLYDYFSQKDGSSIIRSWSKSFIKKDTLSEIQSYQELLGLILLVSGYQPEMEKIQIKSDSFDEVLDEFRRKVENIKQISPLYKLLKNKSDKIFSFWKEISESLITNNVFVSEEFKHFIEWIVAFNCCKIRVIRMSSTLFVCSLFECLVNSIHWRQGENNKAQLKSNRNSKAQNNNQNSLFKKEIALYASIANDLYKKMIVIRVHDIDEQIRKLSINSLTNAIVMYDKEFFDEQRLKYVGRALSDTSPNNRLNAIECFEKIILHADKIIDDNEIVINEGENFISDKKKGKKNNKKSNKTVLSSFQRGEQNNSVDRVKNVLIEFSEMYSPRIIEMCNDSNENVVAEAIVCIGVLIDQHLINPDDCQNIQYLISDRSEIIRKAAANFIAKRIFFDHEDNDNLDHLLLFIQKFHNKIDIQFIVSSLYPYLKCLKKWNEMCDRLISEENDNRSKIISAILLHSAKITFNNAEECNKDNPSKSKNSQETIDKALKKARKLTFILIQNLPQLLKAYQSSKSKEIIQNLVETSSLLDLNAISENSSENQYEKLLIQLHEIFIKFNQDNDENIKLFNSAFNSIYILSKNHNHLSEIAQKELDKLSMLFSDFGSDDDEDNENLNIIIAKFAVAAKIVDISSNEKLKNKILNLLHKKLQKYDTFLQTEISSSESDQEDNEDEELIISNSIECLQYYFKWDVKKIHDFLVNRKIDENENDEVTAKIEKMKEPYINEFHEFSNIFATFLKSTKSSFKIKLSAFKALGTNISLSQILAHDTATGLSQPFVGSPLISTDISDAFYHFFHEIETIKMKAELFEVAELPLIVKAIDIGYSAHLFVYNHISFPQNEEQLEAENDKNKQESEFALELGEKVKKLWKNLAKFHPINGKQLYSAISLAVEKTPSMKSADLRKMSRFFVGKFKVFDFIKDWAEKNYEDEQFLPVVATFLFGLNESEANQLRSLLSDRFIDILDKISNGTKLAAKDISKLQIDTRQTKKKNRKSKNENEHSIPQKSRKMSSKLNQSEGISDDAIEPVELTDDDENGNENDNEDDEQIKTSYNESLATDDDDDDDIGNYMNQNESENASKEDDYESSDVQEINPNDDDDDSQYSQESEVEFQEPDETFVFKH